MAYLFNDGSSLVTKKRLELQLLSKTPHKEALADTEVTSKYAQTTKRPNSPDLQPWVTPVASHAGRYSRTFDILYFQI